ASRAEYGVGQENPQAPDSSWRVIPLRDIAKNRQRQNCRCCNARTSDTERDMRRIRLAEPPIARQSPEREIRAVTVIAKVEHPRKTDRRVPGFVPTSIVFLLGDQVVDTALDGRVRRLAGRHQAE